MLSTFVLATVFLSLLIVSVVLWATFLRLGLRWAKVPDATMWRAVVATAMLMILQIALIVVSSLITPTSEHQANGIELGVLAAQVLLSCAAISVLFKTSFLRAIQAWLPTLLASAANAALAMFVVRPYLYEAFVVPTNSMAPTLLGQHWEGICAECGNPNYCSPRDERFSKAEPPLKICDKFHVTRTSTIDKTVHPGDRFIVAKFLTPRRWDIVVFQYPEEPETMYVKRLVGLPGEKVKIQGGSVWIDGVRQTPPDSIKGIEYLSELPDWPDLIFWGSEQRPALLADDEYFVLGDFSAQAKDSRYWEMGAPGHNPFAVPQSYMKGVVTHTFWSPYRLRIHR